MVWIADFLVVWKTSVRVIIFSTIISNKMLCSLVTPILGKMSFHIIIMCWHWSMNILRHAQRKEMIVANKIAPVPQATNKIKNITLQFFLHWTLKHSDHQHERKVMRNEHKWNCFKKMFPRYSWTWILLKCFLGILENESC